MSLTIEPLSPVIGARVSGLHATVAIEPATADRLNEIFERYAVVCLSGPVLDNDALVRIANVFGTGTRETNRHRLLDQGHEIGVISSDDRDVHGSGERVITGTTWHTDHSFTARPPKATLLHAVEIPNVGGDTSFCNLRAAYAALPAALQKQIDTLEAVHSYQSRRSPRRMITRTSEEIEATPDVVHPLVRRNPVTGERSLYLSTTRLDHIVGMQADESDALIDRLMQHATDERFVYHHRWRVGDVLIWDNRCTMHHANADYPLSARRLMHRIMLAGEKPLRVSSS